MNVISILAVIGLFYIILTLICFAYFFDRLNKSPNEIGETCDSFVHNFDLKINREVQGMISEYYEFEVPGKPVAKARPRKSRKDGISRIYTPQESLNFEQLVGFLFKSKY